LINQDVLVAGGGIGGLAAALALARAGQRVTVLERAVQFSEVGAGIQLGPNALQALGALGVLDAVLAHACLPEAIVVRHATTGRSISHILLGAAVRQRYGQGYATVHRADLHHALLSAVQAQPSVQVCLGQEVGRVHQAAQAQGDQSAGHQSADHVVQVQTSQQTRRAHALVAADGVWSSLRQAVFADGAPRATGHAAYRALLPIAQVPPALHANQVGVWWGRDVHVVHYPVRSGAFLNLVVLSEQSAAQAVPQWASPASADVVMRSVQGACPALRELLACVGRQVGNEMATPSDRVADSAVHTGASQAPASGWQSWHLYDRPAARSWVQGHVALLGDAAHPMLPYLAQGAAMALEDAVALAASAAQHSHWSAALQHYQSQRKARCERVVATARRNGHIFHLPAPWALARDAVLALKGTEVLGMPWLYGAR
jgi:salicylate hydroxylase